MNAIRMFRSGAAALLVVATCSLLSPTAEGALSARRVAQPQVYIVQGVPGAKVDVSIDGDMVRHALQAKAVAGPYDLQAGTHSVRFSAEGWTVTSQVRVSSASSDVVLHWPAELARRPEVTVFDNNLKPVSNDKARLTVAHTAVVPPADIRVDGKVLFANIANGEYLTVDVPAGSYSVEVVPTGQSGNPLLGPLRLPVDAAALTRVFAIGQPRNGSMDAVVQVLPLKQTGSPAPKTVDAGSAGLAAPSSSASSRASIEWELALAGIGGLGLLACCGALVRRRS
ncbi:MAG: DUF4397 domain-containing protein [Nocardioidaceae bacterium]